MGLQPGVCDLAGSSLPGGFIDQWTSAKRLWGRWEAWGSCISSLSSLSCICTLHFLPLGHRKAVWNCPEGSLCSPSHQSSNHVSPLRSALAQCVKKFVPNPINSDGVSGLLDSQWFLHSRSDVYTSDMVRAIHLTSLWFLHLSQKKSPINGPVLTVWTTTPLLNTHYVFQDCKFPRDCTFPNLESLLLLCT